MAARSICSADVGSSDKGALRSGSSATPFSFSAPGRTQVCLLFSLRAVPFMLATLAFMLPLVPFMATRPDVYAGDAAWLELSCKEGTLLPNPLLLALPARYPTLTSTLLTTARRRLRDQNADFRLQLRQSSLISASCACRTPALTREWVRWRSQGMVLGRGCARELAELAQPVLVLEGAEDQRSSRRPFADNMRDCRVQQLQGNKVLPWESAQAVAEAVAGFVRAR